MPLQRATLDNLDDLLELAEIWDNEEDNLEPTSADKLHKAIEEEIVFLFYEEEEEQLIGAMICDENYTSMNLKTLYVHPDHRGEGIGKTMLSSLTETLDKSAMSAFLEVDAHNPAIELYETFDFEVNDKISTIDGHIAMTREPQ